jgi:hypothetical protein
MHEAQMGAADTDVFGIQCGKGDARLFQVLSEGGVVCVVAITEQEADTFGGFPGFEFFGDWNADATKEVAIVDDKQPGFCKCVDRERAELFVL